MEPDVLSGTNSSCREVTGAAGEAHPPPPQHPSDPLTNLSANREEFPEHALTTHGREGLLAREHARHVDPASVSTCRRLEAGGGVQGDK